jgi:hypothetical protein
MKAYQVIPTLDYFSGFRNRSGFNDIQNEAICIPLSINQDISNDQNDTSF